MREGARIGLVIPALNEADSLPQTLAEVPPWIDRVCVADNGSTDATAEKARRAGAVVVHEGRRGYGWACTAGINACADLDIILFADADGADDLSQAHHLVDRIATGEFDFVLGNRNAGLAQVGALGWMQRAGNGLACALIWARFSHRFYDLGPFRALRVDSLQGLQLSQMTYGWTAEMQVRALRSGLRIAEIPVVYRARRAGRSKVSRSLVGALRAGRGILGTILSEPRTPIG